MEGQSSTRLAIVMQSLADSLERLREMPVTPQVRALKARATAYQRAVQGWAVHTPGEEQRAAMVKLVLDLNVEVIALGRGAATKESK
jgi:hypothetical protein